MDSKYRLNFISKEGVDPDELSVILSTAASPVIVEPTGDGLTSFAATFAASGPMSFGRAEYLGDFRCERQAPTNRVLLMMPSRGNALITCGRQEIQSKPGQATIVDLDRPQSIHFRAERRHLILSIDKDTLADRLTQILERPVDGDFLFQPNFDLDNGAGNLLTTLVQLACDGFGQGAVLAQSPLAAASFCESIIALVLENVPHRYSEEMARRVPQPAPRQVKRAIEFMNAHLGDAITIEEIALASNVSVRTLQVSFKQFRMMSPMAYLQQLRLSAAREEILSEMREKTIAEIAMRWGYFHFGRFAADYKKRFGELPSHSRRK
jgi:AraC-like DNA-binding protein